jgi:nicotinamide-nucleotide amidase
MTLFSSELINLSKRTIDAFADRNMRIVTAESCTGGLIVALLTEIEGSSKVVGRSYVTYSNTAKNAVLGVPVDILQEQGAVSADTVLAMAEGALAAAGVDADVAIAVSGVAGPGGGTPQKPVGTVFMATAAHDSEPAIEHHLFSGDRATVRLKTVQAAFDMLGRRVASRS